MWYSGSGINYRFRIGYATSSNGINWTKDTLNPVLDYGPPGSWDFMQVWCGSVLFDNSDYTYKMWYTGGSWFEGQIGYATCKDSIPTGIDHSLVDISRKSINVKIYPNPTPNKTTIKFSLLESDFVTISVYDITGKKLETLFSNRLEKGNHKICWDSAELDDGMYVIQLVTTTGKSSQKVIKIR
jgi:hypothetical protein